MVATTQESGLEHSTDRFPLLREPQLNNESPEHAIDLDRIHDNASSGPSHTNSPRLSTLPNHEDRPPIPQSPSSSPHNSRSSSTRTREEGPGRRRWSPFNTVLWLSIELLFTLAQIIAAIVVLYVSTHEIPQTPLFAWIVGYAVGCAASLPILYWRYLHRYVGTEQGSTQRHQDPSQGNSTSEPNSYITISLTRNTEEEAGQNSSSESQNSHTRGAPNARLGAFMDQWKMALDCFFAVWFVVGNVWIFGGHSSFSDAPNLYRLCIVFLTISCIGCAMPFILCSMICCCLPCIISILGVRDEMNRVRGASEETINALPTHKFKSKDKERLSSSDSNAEAGEGGLVAAGTEKERVISGEDAVCCICLASYANNDELRELPCTHFFQVTGLQAGRSPEQNFPKVPKKKTRWQLKLTSMSLKPNLLFPANLSSIWLHHLWLKVLLSLSLSLLLEKKKMVFQQKLELLGTLWLWLNFHQHL